MPRRALRWLRYFAVMLRDAPGLRNRVRLLGCIAATLFAYCGLPIFRGPVRLALDGGLFEVDPGRADLSAYAPIWIDREYEPDPRFVPPRGGTVLDIGGQIGFFTVRAAQAVAAGRVYAFEPDPVSNRRLRANVEANGLSNVVVIPSAVAGEEGTVHFRAAAHSVDSRIVAAAGKGIEVACTTLDRFVEERGIARIDCLKIDAESSELQILGAAGKLALPRTVSAIVEVHDRAWIREVDGIMAAHGLAKVHSHSLLHFYTRLPEA